jgi:hypothetical protein
VIEKIIDNLSTPVSQTTIALLLREEEGSLRIVPYQYKLLEVLLLLLLTKTIPLLTFVASRLPIKTKGSFGSLPVRKWSQHNQTRLRKKKN